MRISFFFLTMWPTLTTSISLHLLECTLKIMANVLWLTKTHPKHTHMMAFENQFLTVCINISQFQSVTLCHGGERTEQKLLIWITNECLLATLCVNNGKQDACLNVRDYNCVNVRPDKYNVMRSPSKKKPTCFA